MRLGQALEAEQVGRSSNRTLHRDEVSQRADRCLHAIDALDVSARQHAVEGRGKQLFGDEVHHAVRRAERQGPTGGVVVRNPHEGSTGRRLLLVGLTDGGRALTLVIERTADETTWLIVTGWSSTTTERKLLR